MKFTLSLYIPLEACKGPMGPGTISFGVGPIISVKPTEAGGSPAQSKQQWDYTHMHTHTLVKTSCK